jgi:hypothetical protein
MGVNRAQTAPVVSIETKIGLVSYPKLGTAWQSGAVDLKTEFGAMSYRTRENIIIFDPPPTASMGGRGLG